MLREPVIASPVPSDTPAVHALVIGVGRYADAALPALAGAGKAALAFADWLLREHAPPALARGSIDVLASDPSGQPLVWQGATLDPPTLANVQAAVDGWFARVDDNPNHLLVFYFCGHGVQMGDLRSLLLEDVDLASKTDPLRNAIAFDDFAGGMDSCGPRQQVYVLDACRELPAELRKWDDDVGLGQALVRFNMKRRAQLGARTFVVLEAASATQKAWEGPRGAWFTDAMLTVLKGAAGDNRFTSSPDEYSISTRDIADVIRKLTQEGFLEPPAGPQSPVRKGEGDLDFHVPAHPVVPVVVTRKPPATNAGAEFEALDGDATVASHACADDEPWRSTLPIGDYVFRRGADTVSARIAVPRKKVELP